MIHKTIVSAFPGCGKTSYCGKDGIIRLVDRLNNDDSNTTIKAISCDSSRFSRHNFPKNYIDTVEVMLKEVDLIFISSHKEVRDELISRNLPFVLVYPNKNRKEEFLENYTSRGSSKNFVDLLYTYWEKWIDECSKQTGCFKLELGKKFFSGYYRH